MQCYESEALRLQLLADARALIPQTPFDPLALDQALDEFHIERIRDYGTLGPARRAEIAGRVSQLSSSEFDAMHLRASQAGAVSPSPCLS